MAAVAQKTDGAATEPEDQGRKPKIVSRCVATKDEK
jgi:hypothetical protein